MNRTAPLYLVPILVAACAGDAPITNTDQPLLAPSSPEAEACGMVPDLVDALILPCGSPTPDLCFDPDTLPDGSLACPPGTFCNTLYGDGEQLFGLCEGLPALPSAAPS